METKRGNKITATGALASMYSGSWRHGSAAYCEDHDYQDSTNEGCPECLAEDHADNVDTDEGGKL